MRIFVFEFITGGGLLPASSAAPTVAGVNSRQLDHELLAEGRAMVTALASDFAALAGCEVHILRDADVEFAMPSEVRVQVVRDAAEYGSAFDKQATAADWTVVIAPEIDGALLACAVRVLACGGRLLSPGPDIIRLASDKHATAEHLARAGVPVPRGEFVNCNNSAPAGLAFPLVVKPRDGAGSHGVRLVRSIDEYAAAMDERAIGENALTRVEEYCPGDAASVAVLCGPNGNLALAPCRQLLSQDGCFTYLGGSTPLPAALAERASDLASRAVATLAGAVGYQGVDLVLGDDPTGAADRVIEINPRLTTSYVGLRRVYDNNLASAMFDVANGKMPTLGLADVSTTSPVEW